MDDVESVLVGDERVCLDFFEVQERLRLGELLNNTIYFVEAIGFEDVAETLNEVLLGDV